MNKYILLIGILLTLTAVAFLPGLASDTATSSNDYVKFVVLSDPHIGLNETNNTYKMFHYNDKILTGMIDDINKMNDVKFILIAGDLTKDSEPYNHERILEILGKLKAPYFITPGNHDIRTKVMPAANWGSKELIKNYPMPWYNNSSLWYGVDVAPGVHLVSLDSSNYTKHLANWSASSDPELTWLDGDLAKNKNNTIIVLTHRPLNHHKGVDGAEEYSDNAAQVKKILEKYGAHLAFTGHLHNTDIAVNDSIIDRSCPATCVYPLAYTVVELNKTTAKFNTIWYNNETLRNIAKDEAIAAKKNLTLEEGLPSDRNATIRFADLASSPAMAKDKIVIAHRGASGYLPEHTLQAYAMAYGMGADYLEPDLVMTKDKVFICVHDIHLDLTTNVKDVFPNRARKDGRYYAADFNLSEIKQLKVHERTDVNGKVVFPGRFPMNKSNFQVPTFAEMIELVQGLNKATGRKVGIYPEIKNPTWHAAQGLPMERALLDILAQYGYQDKNSTVYVQCFENHSLKMMRNEMGTKLPLIQLIDSGNNTDTHENYSSMVTQEGLKEIATYADGIGPYKMYIESNPKLVQWAHDDGLKVHTWTLRADSLPAKYQNFTQELNQFYFVYGVDGLFTDFTDKAVAFLKSKKNQTT